MESWRKSCPGTLMDIHCLFIGGPSFGMAMSGFDQPGFSLKKIDLAVKIFFY